MVGGAEEIHIESEPLKVTQKVGPKDVCPNCGAVYKHYWGGLIRRYHRAGCDYIVLGEINEKYLAQYPELREL